MAYTLHILSLRCLTAQEAEGDEVYLVVNDRRVWSVGIERMSDTPADAAQIKAYDFSQGLKETPAGWTPIASFDREQFMLRDLQGPAKVQLFERDLLIGDDFLGEVDWRDAERSDFEYTFTGEGARYVIHMRVENQPEAPSPYSYT